MVDFQFTKVNGIAPVGDIRKLPKTLAQVYQKIGLGEIIEAKPKPKSKKK